MAFATTAHLNLRAYRETDKENVLQLENDQRVLRTLRVDYVLPAGPGHWKKMEEIFDGALLSVIVEVKSDYAGLVSGTGDVTMRPGRRTDTVTEYDGGMPQAANSKADGDSFVGYVLLRSPSPRNRDAELFISLAHRWWDHGFGTEVVRWIVGYAFEQLNMHRVSLGLLAYHDRAMKCYKRVGFVEEGRRRKAIFQDGHWVDDVAMGILDEEWFAMQKE